MKKILIVVSILASNLLVGQEQNKVQEIQYQVELNNKEIVEILLTKIRTKELQPYRPSLATKKNKKCKNCLLDLIAFEKIMMDTFTVFIEDENGKPTIPQLVYGELNSKAFTGLHFLEEWYYDEDQLIKKINAIGFIIKKYDEESKLMVDKPLFYIWMNE